MPKTDIPTDAQLRSGHRKRIRERFLADPSSLPDSELLELVLGHIYLRRDNKMLAKRLLARWESLDGLLAASREDLLQVEGCGEPVYSFLLLLREIIARSSRDTLQKKEAVTLAEIASLGMARLKHCFEEEVWAALLDKQNRLLTFRRIRHGTFDQVSLQPLEVAELMIRHRASSLVLIHNHPGGREASSSEDRESTGRIATALRHLGLHLHDHLIITSEAVFSIKLDRRLALS